MHGCLVFTQSVEDASQILHGIFQSQTWKRRGIWEKVDAKWLHDVYMSLQGIQEWTSIHFVVPDQLVSEAMHPFPLPGSLDGWIIGPSMFFSLSDRHTSWEFFVSTPQYCIMVLKGS